MPPIAVLAGGLATRIRPLTEDTPKSMLPVAGEPFIAHQLRLFARQGVSHVVLLVGYRWEQIRDFVGDGRQFGVSVTYVPDGDTLLGTGGALAAARQHLGPEFLVTYGDSWLDAPYAPAVDAFRASGRAALMCVYANAGRWDSSNVIFEHGLIERYSKRVKAPQMQYIDWGLSMLKATALDDFPGDAAWDLAELFEALSLKGELAGFEMRRRFYEIGSFEGLAETNALLAGGAGGKSSQA